MKVVSDQGLIADLAPAQRGVFSTADLRTALAEPHRAELYRRIDALIRTGVLRRFARGSYVAAAFDLPTLSQRLVPDSAVSFEWVLAGALVIGPRPERHLSAISADRPRRFEAHGWRVDFHHVADWLRFGERSSRAGVRETDPEKALLDVLYFHLRGRRALFDIYSDIAMDRLDRDRLRDHLARYRNPRFVAFAEGVLRLR